MSLSRIGLILGRTTLASLFFLGGINKILNYATTQAHMSEAGLPASFLLLPLTICLEIGGALLVIKGGKWAVPAACALAVFTLMTNLVFHRFWAIEPSLAPLELSLFFKNIAIAGALIYIAAQSSTEAPV